MNNNTPTSSALSWGRRVFNSLRSTVAFDAKTAGRQVAYLAACLSNLVLWLVSGIWYVITPTVSRALLANRRYSRLPAPDADSEQAGYRKKLRDCTTEEVTHAASTLFSIYESDRNRVRGIEAKALGSLQIGSLVFAGDAAALNLALREGASHPTWVIGFVVASGAYLIASLGAALYVTKPRATHVLSIDEVLPPEVAASTLAVATKLNQHASVKMSNLTESAIFDVGRAFLAAAIALTGAVVFAA